MVSRRPVMWRVLTNERGFDFSFIGAALPNFGNRCHSLAGILLVYRLTDSVLLVGIA